MKTGGPESAPAGRLLALYIHVWEGLYVWEGLGRRVTPLIPASGASLSSKPRGAAGWGHGADGITLYIERVPHPPDGRTLAGLNEAGGGDLLIY